MRVILGALAIVLVGCGSSSSGGEPDAGISDAGVVDDDAAPGPSSLLCLLERRNISDLSLLQRNVYEYNAAGALTVLDVDNTGDGTFNYREYRSYNDKNQLVTLERDDSADGSINRLTYYVRDHNQGGRLLYYLHDSNIAATGGPVWEYQWRYAYENGLIVTEERDNDITPAVDNIFERRVRIYDSNDRLIQYEFDRSADTTINYRDVRTYNDDGQLIQQDIEDRRNPVATVDGTLTLILALDYDDDGRLVQRLFDRDADGVFDEREDRIYDCD
jgi:hypothetical protein